MPTLRCLYLLLPVVLCALASQSQATTLNEQRSMFRAAEKALRAKQPATYERLLAQLDDYPLRPYLEYQALRGRFAVVNQNEVDSFLRDHAATPLAPMLRGQWLAHLAEQGRWADYLRNYQPGASATRRCNHLRALMATGRSDEALPQVEEVWLHGKSRPKVCDPVFDAWTRAGLRSPQLIWQRIELAMESGEWRLANYLGRNLPESDRVWVDRWVALRRAPDLALQSQHYDQAHPYRETMLAYAVRRLARKDGLAALKLWQEIDDRYPFDAEQRDRTEQYIARNLVRIADDRAYGFLKDLQLDDDDLPAQHARIRTALGRQDWRQVVSWINVLPAHERTQERWTYWLARGLEGSGHSKAADAIYRDLARQRSYYGFLAADRAGQSYRLDHADTPVGDQAVAEIEQIPAVVRANELFALKRWTEGRREWRYATRDLDQEQLKAAAKLAQQRGWHDRAIFTLARTGYWDDLELRFPLEYSTLVRQNADRHDIEVAWVFAVMRQESAFMPNARSHAGAMGLMQLMPATARSVAREMLARKPPARRELFKPDINIALGSAYLKQMRAELGGSTVLATAAYNAGPHRVIRWLPPQALPADIWIELVPFRETRAYLERVLAYTVIYDRRMGRQPTRLSRLLHAVTPTVNAVGQADVEHRRSSSG